MAKIKEKNATNIALSQYTATMRNGQPVIELLDYAAPTLDNGRGGYFFLFDGYAYHAYNVARIKESNVLAIRHSQYTATMRNG